MEILVVEDNKVIQKIIRQVLAKAGHEAICLDNGEAAWEMVNSSPIRFVITDWMLPTMDGIELIKRIRTGELESYVYVILITGKTKLEDIVSGLQAGADDYLTKPFHPYELEARVAVGNRILNLEHRLLSAQESLQKLAFYDELTKILNRRAFYDRASAEISRADRLGTSLSFLFIDVDNFKMVNDDYGHLIGDDVLKLLTTTVSANVRAYDLVGRWAGDEFIVLLPNTSIRDAQNVAERLLTAINTTSLHLQSGELIEISVSIGISVRLPSSEPSLNELIKQADQAMYASKTNGGNQVSCFAKSKNQN